MVLEEQLIYAIRLHDKQKIDKLLSEKTLNIHYEKDSKSLLMYAVREGLIEVVEKLIKLGANVNFNGNWETPLRAAILARRIDLANLLLKNGADVNLPCLGGYSHLHLAILQGDFQIVKTLIQNKANIHFIDCNERRPGDQALEYGDPDIIRLLWGYKAGWNLQYSRHGRYTLLLINFLTKPEQDVKTLQDARFLYDGNVTFSFFTLALKFGHWKIAELLYQKKVSHVFRDSLGSSFTALLAAVQSSSSETVRWVLSIPEFKEDINSISSYPTGITPLGYAVRHDYLAMAKILVQNGALIQVSNPLGHNPLFWAYQASKFRMVRYLLRLGANPVFAPKLQLMVDEFPGAIKFNQRLTDVNSILNSDIIKFLICYVELDYYRRTKDFLRKDNKNVLNYIIQTVAAISSVLIAKMHQTTFGQEAEAYQKLLEEVIEERLSEALIKSPAELLQPYLGYGIILLENNPKNTLETFDKFYEGKNFWGVINSFLSKEHVFLMPKEFSSLPEVGYALHYCHNVENISKISEVKVTQENLEKFRQECLLFSQELNQKRTTLVKGILLKYQKALLLKAQKPSEGKIKAEDETTQLATTLSTREAEFEALKNKISEHLKQYKKEEREGVVSKLMSQLGVYKPPQETKRGARPS